MVAADLTAGKDRHLFRRKLIRLELVAVGAIERWFESTRRSQSLNGHEANN